MRVTHVSMTKQKKNKYNEKIVKVHEVKNTSLLSSPFSTWTIINDIISKCQFFIFTLIDNIFSHLIPVQAFYIHQDSHELRNGQRWMRVIQLDRHLKKI